MYNSIYTIYHILYIQLYIYTYIQLYIYIYIQLLYIIYSKLFDNIYDAIYLCVNRDMLLKNRRKYCSYFGKKMR